ncbi:hypothetical protein SLEP1_g45264 [Rubroshorea leprosula]|uniref:Transposase (putative) gypsy type domain-containing protein n=1 Tax=Rubroshorea leprosula TaxID=152421 RepID=A0AAV5LKQ7_9ROSI|nr:hypothetical protein SLEP1_g45264 [Rubroshorea leprosula]
MKNVVGNVSDLPVIEEWESRTITGRLSNLRKAPEDLPAGFRFKAVLHHEVADSASSISGYRKLEEMVRAYHIPRMILLWTGAQNERACTVSQTGWIPVYVDHFEVGLRFPLPGLIFDLLVDYELALTQLTPNSIRFIIGFMLLCVRLEVLVKAIVFRSLFQCRLFPNSRGAKWYYLSGREKSQLFKNVRNKVARWKRQFIFVRDTPIERISNDLVARLSKWRVPNAHVNYPQMLPRDMDIKNQLLEYARRENLIDLEALVTLEQLAVFGFVDVANLFIEGHATGNALQRQTRFDERSPPMPQSRSSSHRGSSSASRPRFEQRVEAVAPSACRRAHEETNSKDEVPLTRRRTSVAARPAQAAQTTAARSSNAPSATARAAEEPASASALVSALRITYPDDFSYVKPDCQPAMVQGMQSFVPPVDRQRARTFVQQHGEQVSMVKLMDVTFSYVVALFESEQGARSQNNELSGDGQPSCKQLATEKASLVDDVNRLQGSEMANRAAATESRADELADRNNELREELEQAHTEKESGIQAVREEAAKVEERAKKVEAERDRALNELSSLRHQIYNEIHGKVLHHRPDFPICELAFFDGEDIDEQGKSLAPLADTTVRLRWDLNEEGVPIWPPSVLEEGSPVNVPAPEPTARSSPARSSPPATNVSMLVNLTDD